MKRKMLEYDAEIISLAYKTLQKVSNQNLKLIISKTENLGFNFSSPRTQLWIFIQQLVRKLMSLTQLLMR